MKFIVEFSLKPDCKNKAVDFFEAHGPNRHPGVSFRGAWIGTRSDVVFVLTESEDESLVAKVGQAWSEFGSFRIHPVVDVEQF